MLYVACFSGQVAVGQSPKARTLYEQALKLFAERRAAEAIPFMQEALRLDPHYVDAHLKLGQLYEYTRQPELALAAYRNVLRLQPSAQPGAAATTSGATAPTTDNVVAPAYQGAANILLRLGRYAEALPLLEAFQQRFPAGSAQARRLERQLATARFGQEALQHPQPVDPRPLSAALNTTPSQYFPVLTADEQTLVFTALKPEGDEDLLTTTFNGETWSPPQSLSPAINTPDNEGTATLSADGRTLVFTACQGRRGFGSCDLYISRKTGSTWAEPQNLGNVVNTRHYESQPALSADGRRLYFVSDRPGGLGRRDIWQSDLDAAGRWQEPVNLGAPINTVANEASPFIHANGRSLFFASDGHVGMGGYDLFVSDSVATGLPATTLPPAGSSATTSAVVTAATPGPARAGWAAPLNLGYPINTSEDQASLFVAANGTRAYYSYEEQKDGVSQRSRIYVFDLPDALRERIRPANYLKGVVTDARTRRPLPATVELIELQTNRLVGRLRADPETGQYTAVLPSGGEYALYVSGPGYLFKSLSFDFVQPAKTERSGRGLTLDVALEPVRADAARETLNNLFFETGRYDLAAKSRTELDRLTQFLKANPTLTVEIAGHTDDQGEPAANLVLSRRRAQSVVAYLTQAGIEPGRIRATGYGETRPLVPNTSDDARRQNRRIEWRIL